MASIISFSGIILIFIVGIFPTLIWLAFWLREDRYQPEPIGLLFLTFIAGAIAVFLVLPFESFATRNGISGVEKILIFAAAEEMIKFFIVFAIDFSSSYLDEPIDYAIYLITGSLGFAGAENVLFLLNKGVPTNISFIIETGILRFLGATVLHSILAAILGLSIGFVFYKSRANKIIFATIGLIIVIILHTLFNYFIIKYIQFNGFLTLGILWFITLIIIHLFERVRAITH